MARCKVADLEPLVGLPLTRLVFDPAAAKKGIEGIRSMKTMQEIGLDFEQRLKPSQFWQVYDTGAFGGRE